VQQKVFPLVQWRVAFNKRCRMFVKEVYRHSNYPSNTETIYRTFDHEVREKSAALYTRTGESACRDFQPSKITVIVIIIIVPPSSIPMCPHSRVPALLPPPESLLDVCRKPQPSIRNNWPLIRNHPTDIDGYRRRRWLAKINQWSKLLTCSYFA